MPCERCVLSCKFSVVLLVQILGARKGLALTLLNPPLTALLGQLTLGEALSLRVWLAILVTVVGIGIVMRERAATTPEQQIRPGTEPWGIFCGLLGVGGMAIGSIVMKMGTVNVDVVEATFIRLFVSGLFGIVLSGWLGQLPEIRALFQSRRNTLQLSTAAFLGTVLGVLLMMAAYKYCLAGIAATLTSTAPLFVIPVVWIFLKHPVSRLSWMGAAIAFGGVCVLVFR